MNTVTETVFTIKNLKFEYVDIDINDLGDRGVDVFHFETQTDASTVRIEGQNIMTDKKIDIMPVIKERFGLDTPSRHPPMRPIQSPPPSKLQLHSPSHTQTTKPVGGYRNMHITMMNRPFIKH